MLKTLSSIAPIWANRIKEGRVKNYITELGDTSRCIVGEAWRYSDEYLDLCNFCHIHALYLTNFKNQKRFKQAISLFEQHWNKEHLPN